MIRFSYCFFIVSIAGCSISPFGEMGSFYSNFQVLEEGLCAGMYEIKLPLSNGPKPKRQSNSMLFKEFTHGINEYYVTQSSPEVCWSASLETIFRYSGLNFHQQQFRDSLEFTCPTSFEKNSATANQILFSATETHARNQGIWLGKYSKLGIDIDYCDLINLLSLLPWINSAYCKIESSYHRKASDFFLIRNGQESEGLSKTITMTSTKKNSGELIYRKRIILIESLSEMLIAMDSGYPVFVAMNGKGNGHTVILQDVTFYVNKYKKRSDGGYDYSISNTSHLKNVKYLDPMLGSMPMKGDEFLERVGFSFYIEN